MFLYMLRFIFTFLPSHLMRQNCELLSVCREQASQQATKPPLGRPTTTSIRVSIRDSNHGQSFRMHAHHHELSSQYLLAHGRLVNEGIGLDFSPSSRFWFRSTLPVSTFQVWRWHSIWFGKFHHPRSAWAPPPFHYSTRRLRCCLLFLLLMLLWRRMLSYAHLRIRVPKEDWLTTHVVRRKKGIIPRMRREKCVLLIQRRWRGQE